MQRQDIFVLWDDAHIWGLMALRALTQMRLPCQLVSATAIAQGALLGKPSLLLTPGGSARRKSAALGEAGREAIRAYVRQGGNYLGFCGGAGLGLSDPGGLALCPWTRAPYTDRIQHLVSGHVRSRLAGHPLCPPTGAGELSLPVWWPGRFAPPQEQVEDGVTVLASYLAPDRDLCLTDLPLADLPPEICATWRAAYGIDMGAGFLAGQPCVIHGRYGAGQYVLSYSHLETPDSPTANTFMAHVLERLAGIGTRHAHTPPWRIEHLPTLWPRNRATRPLFAARSGVNRLIRLGVRHRLLFKRTPWLWGWRTGIPGAALNNLHAALNTALGLPPTEAARAFLRDVAGELERVLPTFLGASADYLLAERLATTLASGLGEGISRGDLRDRREALFGKPMAGGGLYQQLVDIADKLVFLLAGGLDAPPAPFGPRDGATAPRRHKP